MALFNQSRSNIIRLIFGAVFLVIILQLFNLQVVSRKYRQLAMVNAVFAKVRYPDRGIIFDRNGKAILNNTITYDLMVTPSEVRNIDTIGFCNLMEIDMKEFKRRLLEARLKNGPYRPSYFEDVLIPALHARLDENIWKYPGFALVERPIRVYPFNAGAHIMGYIGEADSAIIRRSKNFYRLGDYVGRNGLEAFYENVLMGKRGVQYMIKDNKNRLVGSYENGIYDTAAVAGRNLQTYIDIEVQQLAERLLNNKVGAIVAIEPKTGGIIAMASGPGYNPNDLTGPERQKNFSRLSLNVAAPLFNRSIKGQYPAGSTYKPIGALIALDEGLINQASGINCTGAYFGCSRPVNCTEKFAGHSGNLRQSIAWSCNSFFCDVFRKTVDNYRFRNPRKGLTVWKDYMAAFGFGHRIGVDLPSEDGGNIPDTLQYDKEYRGSWNSCTMVTLGIGQDKMTVTPLQMANAMCIVANKGYYFIPHFVKTIGDESKQDTMLWKFRKKHEVLTHISDAVYEEVISGMQDVVDIGTARIAKIPGINICAKTGTAENKMVLDGKVLQLKDNSMFVCFAPRENPRIAVAVVIQNAGFGATWAAPIGSLIMEKFLNDTLRAESVKKIDEIAAASLMPAYLPRLQFKTDSIRSFEWFKMTKDSSFIRKFIRKGASPKLPPPPPKPTVKQVAIIHQKKNQTLHIIAKR